ncbi:MAG: UDP-3-O-(3-hydroxymyristoyl)glucosamine N-acyltransferase [Atribacterota bacterium]|nr:UDP-3-O-(3-hydroxymyristoyl)glucosamine N-acyltransferase [Candidatus Atribacteria bacterium]
MKLKDIAQHVRGRLSGDPEYEIQNISTWEKASSDEVVFLFDFRHLSQLRMSSPGAVILKEGWELKDIPGTNLLYVENPRLALAQLLPLFRSPVFPEKGIHPLAFIYPQATVGEEVSVGAFAYVGKGVSIGKGTVLFPQVYVGDQVVIGQYCILYPQVVIRENCVLGDRVILHSGAVIGSDGFGYERSGKTYQKIPQVGRVVLENDVEVGANATIDRATLGETKVGQGTKIDNLVIIAHNVQVGENVIIVAQSGVAGSSVIGNDVIMAGQSGVADHCTVGEGVQMAARTGVSSDIAGVSLISGFPAQNHQTELKEKAFIRKLPEIWHRLRNLEKSVFKQ